VHVVCVREWGGAEQSHLCKMFILIMILSDVKRYEVIFILSVIQIHTILTMPISPRNHVMLTIPFRSV
jgi:hypothetical protein